MASVVCPDLLGLVLDPAGRREMLRELLLGTLDDGIVSIEEDGAREDVVP